MPTLLKTGSLMGQKIEPLWRPAWVVCITLFHRGALSFSFILPHSILSVTQKPSLMLPPASMKGNGVGIML